MRSHLTARKRRITQWLLVVMTMVGLSCSSGESQDADSLSDVGSDVAASEIVADTTVGDVAPDLGLDQPDLAVPCDDSDLARPLSSAQADETFDLGPWVMMLRPDSVTVMWRTLEDSDGTVLYGLETPDMELVDEAVQRVHEVVLTGLLPNTRYAYAVRSGGLTSETHHFTTAVPDGSPFRFVLWGDNQNGPEVFSGIVEQMIGVGPHIALGVGDHVQDGDDPALWKDQLFGPARALFQEVPFYAAMGNHESNGDDYYALYAYPHPEEDPVHESYYSFTYGNMYILVLDTNTLLCPLGEVDVPQSEFIKQAVNSPEAQAATWRIAYAHEPPYSESWGDGDCNYDGFLCVRNWVLPLLAENGYHAYFSGHTHDYERGLVDGVVQIIAGGGGGGLDRWCMDWETTDVIYQNHHFIQGDAGCELLRLEAINQAGETVDWVEMAPDGTILDQGPAEGLPEILVNSDSPTLD